MKSLKDQIEQIGDKQKDLEIQLAEFQLQQELTNCQLELAEMATSETQ